MEGLEEKKQEILESIAPDAQPIDCAAEAISQALGVQVFSYNDQITEDFIRVFKYVAEDRPACTDEITKNLSLDRNYVELMQYILCNNDHAEYGTSPRCCWLTKKGYELFNLVKEFHNV